MQPDPDDLVSTDSDTNHQEDAAAQYVREFRETYAEHRSELLGTGVFCIGLLVSISLSGQRSLPLDIAVACVIWVGPAQVARLLLVDALKNISPEFLRAWLDTLRPIERLRAMAEGSMRGNSRDWGALAVYLPLVGALGGVAWHYSQGMGIFFGVWVCLIYGLFALLGKVMQNVDEQRRANESSGAD